MALARRLRPLGLACMLACLWACDDGTKSNQNDDSPDNRSETVACGPGTEGLEGCVCAAGGECEPGLVCSADNICESDSCAAGSLGCVCTAAGECNSTADECVAGVCSPRTSCVSELGCVCDPAGACANGLDCTAGVCRAANSLLLSIAGGDARACDILVESTSGRHVADTAFVAGVRGQARAKNERGSIALIRTEDSALAGVVASVQLAGPDAAAVGDLTVTSASCFDRTGAPDAAVSVSVE